MTIEADVSQTWHDAIIELFELDLEPITGSSTDKYYFTANLMPDNTKIQWQGITYEPLPIAAAGFERTTKGQIPTPELTVANVLGTLAAVVNTLDDLVGAKVTRRRTLLKYLDGGSSPDPSQEFPDDMFYIERKIAESSITITWQLASKIDLEGLQLPRRIITQNYCLWKYRGPECGYTGPAVADENDRPITIGGASSAAGIAYVNAYKAFDSAKKKLAAAEAKKNNLFAQQKAACDEDAVSSLFEKFSFRQSGSIGYSFVIQDGDGNTIISIFNNEKVRTNGNAPPYRPSAKQKTGLGPGGGLNGTGPVYRVVNYVPTDGGSLRQVDVGFSNQTFGIYDLAGEKLLFINGSIVEPRVGYLSTGYDLGNKASDGFAPMRAISELDYNNSNCSPITNAYNNAVAQYEAALSEYNDAESALEAAYAALPSNDDVSKRDKCGKRLQSCQLRFGIKGALPFGGFPGANLTR